MHRGSCEAGSEAGLEAGCGAGRGAVLYNRFGEGFEGEVGGSVERFAGSVRAFKNVFMLPEKRD